MDLLTALADLGALVPVAPTPNGVGHTCAAQVACLAEEGHGPPVFRMKLSAFLGSCLSPSHTCMALREARSICCPYCVARFLKPGPG